MKKEDKLLIKYLQRELETCYSKFYFNRNCCKHPGIAYGMKDYYLEITKLLSHLQKKKFIEIENNRRK